MRVIVSAVGLARKVGVAKNMIIDTLESFKICSYTVFIPIDLQGLSGAPFFQNL